MSTHTPASPSVNQPPDPAAAQYLFQIGAGYMLSAAVQVAIELRIADQLAGGPKPVGALAAGSGRAVNEDALYRTLRALASAGIFTETTPRAFALTPPAEY